MPTALNFTAKSLKSNRIRHSHNEDSSDSHFVKQAEQTSHVRMPSDMEEKEGSIVKARYPFNGNPEMLQMSFSIGDEIMILQKDDRWSWGKVVKTGEVINLHHIMIKILLRLCVLLSLCLLHTRQFSNMNFRKVFSLIAI